MKKSIFLIVVLAASCSLMEPTYRDIPPAVIEAIAEQYQVSSEEMILKNREALKAEIQDQLDMTVDRLIVGISRETGKAEVTAEIAPASEDAAKEALDRAPTDPTNWAGWGVAGLAAILIAAQGLLGKRGRATKEKEVA